MRPGGRAVPVVNGLLPVGLVVVLAVVALVVKPPSPPGIAEFAPQASKPISRAPLSQSARFGTDGAACTTRQSCAPGKDISGAAPTPVPAGVVSSGVPSALQCYTWPDGSVTQTFDPQSPPCIATWDTASGNG